MWSLPEISSLNARAKSCATAYDRQARLKKSVKHPCECCGHPSVAHEKYYDIFSPDAKGVRHLCRDCEADGRGQEGYFHCDQCERLVVENYTWEYYRVQQDGQILCLTCAAENYFQPDNLINPKQVKAVELNTSNGQFWNLHTGVLNLAKAQHVLGVKQPVPEGVVYVDNLEFDSYSGRQISGDDAIDIIRKLDGPFWVVLDGAYQFAASIGIYQPK